MTQCERLLKHFEDHETITPIEAMNDFGIMRLGARIWDLKHEGHDIRRKMVTGKNRNGETVRYAEYRLIRGDADAG